MNCSFLIEMRKPKSSKDDDCTASISCEDDFMPEFSAISTTESFRVSGWGDVSEMTADAEPQNDVETLKASEKDVEMEKKDVWNHPPEKKPLLIDSEESKKRSRRMFGMMLGTLNSLKGKSSSEIQREKVQEKLLAKLAAEKKEMESKIQQENLEKKSKILEKRKTDDSLRYKIMVETVESALDTYSGFCQTETVPQIYFLPKVHSEKSLENLKKSKEKVENLKKSLTFNHQEYLNTEYPPDSQAAMDVSVDVQMSDSVEESKTTNSMQDIVNQEKI